MSVFEMSRGEEGVILSIGVEGAAGERLKALGAVKGAKVTCLAFSMFRGSVLISIGGNRIAIRRSIAEKIAVKGVAT